MAQRACLDLITSEVGERAGPVVELGLGNGRTYDHLRERVGSREVFVFERSPDPHPLCQPDDSHLIVGDLEDTLPKAMHHLGQPAIVAHSDIGTGDAGRNARVAKKISELLPAILADRAMIASDQALSHDKFEAVDLPCGVEKGRYFIYRYNDTQ